MLCANVMVFSVSAKIIELIKLPYFVIFIEKYWLICIYPLISLVKK